MLQERVPLFTLGMLAYGPDYLLAQT